MRRTGVRARLTRQGGVSAVRPGGTIEVRHDGIKQTVDDRQMDVETQMNEQTAALIARLAQEIPGLTPDQVDEIIRQAQVEALAEVKALLKETMMGAMLASALERLEADVPPTWGRPVKVVPTEPGAGAALSGRPNEEKSSVPAAPVEGPGRAPSPDEDVRREIEAIRRQIAENERLLREVGPEPASGAQTSEVLEPAEVPVRGEGSDPVSENGLGCYLYAIMSAANDGIGDDVPAEGIDPAHPVYRVHHRDLQGIVSQVPLCEFGQEELENHLDDIKWVEARVFAHQQVLDALVTCGTLVPMRFCTIYRSEDSLRQALDQHYDEFSATLAHLSGKQEWGVKAYCDANVLALKVEDIDPGIKERRAELSLKSGGAAYFKKKKLEEAIQVQAERISDEKAQCCHDRLSAHCTQAVLGSLQKRADDGEQSEMILNGAYLVADEQWADFSAELQSLNAELGPLGFRIELTGPWPPYNFTGVETEGEAHEPERSE